MIQAFIHGIILAFGLILPLGVQNIFILNQGVIQKRWHRVLPVVITAALCDTLLISLAVLGVSAIVLSFAWLQWVIVIIGVIFLGYMGVLTWNTKQSSSESNETTNKWSIRKQIIFAMSVSLLNPHAIIDTIGVIGTSALTYSVDERMFFSFGTIITSWIWFLALSLIGRIIGISDRKGYVKIVINRISAIIMWLSAIYLIYSLM